MSPFAEAPEEAPRRSPFTLGQLASRWPGGRMGRGFWILFTAAFFFDLGFGIYFFLFNLYLVALHLNERTVGFITGALTLGSVAGTIPVGILCRKLGLRPLLLFCFVATPVLSVLRLLVLWPPAQIGLAFLTGMAICSWPVCFSPAIAKLTAEEHRAFAFSIVFATGIGSGALAGILGGYLPQWLGAAAGSQAVAENMRLVLLVASGVALLGTWSILKLRLDNVPVTSSKIRFVSPFLLRFLPATAAWNFVIGAFTPFANIYLSQHLKISLAHIGIIFSASQLVQVASVLMAPLLLRRLGTVAGIACTQIATGLALCSLAGVQRASLAVTVYLGFTGVQWMSGPGIYSLLMSKTPEAERGTASAIQNIVNSLSQSAAAALAGILFVRYGYPRVVAGNGGMAILAAVILFLLLGSKKRRAAGA